MKFSCDNCGAKFQIADDKVGPRGAKARCPKCSETIFLSPPEELEPDPAADPPSSEAAGGPAADPLESDGLDSDGLDSDGLESAFDDALAAMERASTEAPDEAPGEASDEASDEVPDAPPEGAPSASSDDAPRAAGRPEAWEAAEPADEAAPPTEAAEAAEAAGADVAHAAPRESASDALAGLEERDELREMQASLQAELARDLDLGPAEPGHDPGRVAQELGSAFEQMFEAEGAAPEPEGEAEAPAEPQEAWFVAIRDEQVGPLSREEIEAKWGRREIMAGTLAWREGLSDWRPVGEIEDLADLPDMARRRREEPSEDLSYEGLPEIEGPKPRPEAPVREDSAAGWQPSAASALDSLAEEELAEARSRPPEPAASPFSGLAAEPASGPAAGGSPGREPGPTPPRSSPFAPAPEPSAVLATSTLPVSTPPPRTRRTGVVLAAAVVLLIAGGAAAAVLMSRGDRGGDPLARGPSEPAGGAAAPTVSERADAGPGDAEAADAALRDAAAASDAGVDAGVDAGSEDAGAPSEAKPAPKPRRTERRASSPPRRTTRKPPPRRPPSDRDLLGGRGSALPAKPSDADIKKALLANKDDVLRCLAEQKRADPSLKGQMTVRFTLTGDGRARRVTVVPAQFRDARVGRCLIKSVRTWRFPQFSGEAVPVNFPVILRGG